MEVIPILALFVAVAFPLCVGFLASLFGNAGESGMYPRIDQIIFMFFERGTAVQFGRGSATVSFQRCLCLFIAVKI